MSLHEPAHQHNGTMMRSEPNSPRAMRRRGDRAVADVTVGFDAGAAGQETFTIRDLTLEFGISARTLRFYEEKGLISPRRNGQERLYSRRDRARLKYVRMGKTVGFSIVEVRERLELYDRDDGQ